MGLPRSLLRTALPISRAGAALWAWRNRSSLAQWGAFGVRAAQQVVAGDRSDVTLEARLRAAITGDAVTRSAGGLRVAVHDGVATLSGTVTATVADATLEKAHAIDGITKVVDDLTVLRSRKDRGS
ncbi:hypothetical protein BH20ACT2_BH20ACT2_12980 [soil metagenome]